MSYKKGGGWRDGSRVKSISWAQFPVRHMAAQNGNSSPKEIHYTHSYRIKKKEKHDAVFKRPENSLWPYFSAHSFEPGEIKTQQKTRSGTWGRGSTCLES